MCYITLGQILDGPQNGIPPGPWDIQAVSPSMFQNSFQEVEVPHTASVKVWQVKSL